MSYRTDTGIVLLDPAEKIKRYSRQMKNEFICETGEKLSSNDMAYKAGYLSARRYSAKSYCSNKEIKSKAKPRNRKKPRNWQDK